VRGKCVNELCKPGLVFEQSSDVVKENPGLGEVGHGAHQLFEILNIDRLNCFRHSYTRSKIGLEKTLGICGKGTGGGQFGFLEDYRRTGGQIIGNRE
jgi:hypothetical protein